MYNYNIEEFNMEIETKHGIKKIKNPTDARVLTILIFSFIQILDDTKKWQTVAKCFVWQDAKFYASEINYAITNMNDIYLPF